MDTDNYTIDEHAHRFAVWTAARAASRSRLKNTEVEHLINPPLSVELGAALSPDF